MWLYDQYILQTLHTRRLVYVLKHQLLHRQLRQSIQRYNTLLQFFTYHFTVNFDYLVLYIWRYVFYPRIREWGIQVRQVFRRVLSTLDIQNVWCTIAMELFLFSVCPQLQYFDDHKESILWLSPSQCTSICFWQYPLCAETIALKYRLRLWRFGLNIKKMSAWLSVDYLCDNSVHHDLIWLFMCDQSMKGVDTNSLSLLSLLLNKSQEEQYTASFENEYRIRIITKLPNSEQSYKGKVKTHKYINRKSQSTTGKLWKPKPRSLFKPLNRTFPFDRIDLQHLINTRTIS